MQFKLKGASKGEKFHVYEAFGKTGGGKLYVPIKEGVEPKQTLNVKVG